jgi:hypothetical protein
MANGKKPSIYSDRGGIGSADELDEYGVWVKSEPQVLSAGSYGQGSDNLSQDFEDIDFPGSGLPGSDSEDSFGTDFEDFAISEDSSSANDIYGKDDFGIPTVKSIESNINSIQDDFESSVRGKDGGDLSTQLLVKIANELSSIRGELHALKKEFSVVRVSPSEGEKDGQEEQASEHERSGFFSEEEDETIALTGDELDNILNTADFTEEAGANETPEADFPAEDETEKQADEQLGETPDASSGEQAIDASLADLDLGEQPAEEAAPVEEAIDNDFIDIDADALGIDLKPENILDEQTSVEEKTESSDTEESDIAIGDITADDIGTDDIAVDEIASDDLMTDDVSADDLSSTDLSSEGITADDTASDDLTMTDDVSSDTAAGDTASDDLSMTDDLSSDDLMSDDLSLDDISSDDLSSSDLSSDDIITSDTATDDIEASGLDSPEELPEETETAETSDSAAETELDGFDAEISQIDDLSDDFGVDIAETASVDEEKDSDELAKLREEGAKPVTFPPENASYLEEDKDIDIDLDDSDSLDLSDAVIDEPELSTDGIVDGPATEPDIDIASLDEFDAVGTDDEQALEIPQDLDIDIDMPAEEADDVEPVKDDDFNISAGDDAVVEDVSLSDDTIDQVIPEGFEAEIEETPVPFDDDLEGQVAAEEIEGALELPEEDEEFEPLSPPLETPKAGIAASPSAAAPSAGVTVIQATGGENLPLSSVLKSELKNILSYMDQLLESLPEEKIEEFARSEYFDSYKKLFKELGLV